MHIFLPTKEPPMPHRTLLTLIATVIAAAGLTIAIAAIASPALGLGAAFTSLALLAAAAALRLWLR
ncbi:MAG: hypothetical protein AAFQ79_08945 [Pseudomonadota bacterium]